MFRPFTLGRKKSSAENTASLQKEIASMQEEIDKLKHEAEQEQKNMSLKLVIEEKRHKAEVEKMEEKIAELRGIIETYEKQSKHDMFWPSQKRTCLSETPKLTSRLPVQIHVVLPSAEANSNQNGSEKAPSKDLKSLFARNKKPNIQETKPGHVFSDLEDAMRLVDSYDPATNIEVIIHEGEFSVRGEITIKRGNVKINGQGVDKTTLRMERGSIVFQENARGTFFSNIRLIPGESRLNHPILRVVKANTVISNCEIDGGDCYIAGDKANSEFTVSHSSNYSSSTTEENFKQQMLHQPVQVLNTVFRRSPGFGLMLYNYSSAIVAGCEIYDCRDSGIMISDRSDPLIHNTKIHDNDQCGILMKSCHGIIEGNEIYGNKSHGIELDVSANPLLRDNTIRNNGGFAILIHEEGKGRIDSNTMTDNALGTIDIHENASPEIIRPKPKREEVAAADASKGKTKMSRKEKREKKKKEKKEKKRKKAKAKAKA